MTPLARGRAEKAGFSVAVASTGSVGFDKSPRGLISSGTGGWGTWWLVRGHSSSKTVAIFSAEPSLGFLEARLRATRCPAGGFTFPFADTNLVCSPWVPSWWATEERGSRAGLAFLWTLGAGGVGILAQEGYSGLPWAPVKGTEESWGIPGHSSSNPSQTFSLGF